MKVTSSLWFTLCLAFTVASSSLRGEGDNSTPVRSAADQPIFQKPRLISGLGRVDFAIGSKSALAQLYFNQGLAMLYHCDERQAECAFRQTAAIDPDCAIAHWGLALVNRRSINDALPHLQRAFVLSEGQQLSARELLLIDGFLDDWSEESETAGNTSKRKAFAIKQHQLGDSELDALLLWRMLEATDRGLADFDWELARTLLRAVLERNPAHPVQVEWLARYRPDRPEQLLSAAKQACEVMPRAPRAWREAGGVCARAGRYEDAVLCYETAMRLEHERMHEDRLLPEQVPGHGETLDGLIENLTRLGRVHDALALARQMVTTPCLAAGPRSARSDAMCVKAQRTVLDLMSRYELWDETIEMSQSPVWNAFCPELEVDQQLVLGSAHFFTGDAARGREQMTRLKTLWLKSLIGGGGSAEEDADDVRSPGAWSPGAWSPEGLRERLAERLTRAEPAIERIESALNELKLDEAYANQNWQRLRELLDREPGVDAIHLTRLHLALGNVDRAKSLAFEVPAESRHRVLDLANQANVLHVAGDEQAARARVDELRLVSAVVDADLPMIRRVSASLTPVATAADDRPNKREPLACSRWHPCAAPDLTLPNRHGELVSLDDFRDRPVLVVFYLGAGCPHCIQQLRALAPVHQEFVEAGITVIAVSSDTIAGMQQMYEVADADGEGDAILPFLLVSDSLQDRFREFRAFDEFRGTPLHGTFLLDGQRRVLWQNIGEQPYMEVGFLLDESKRLLRHSQASANASGRKARASGSQAAFN